MATTTYISLADKGGQTKNIQVVDLSGTGAGPFVPTQAPVDGNGVVIPFATRDRQDTMTAAIGTDGTSPPTIAGTGVRGWLRAIFEKLVSGLSVTGPATNAELRASALPVSISGTIPVSGALTDTQLRATAVAIQASALPLPAGAATAAAQTTANTSLSSLDTKLPAKGVATAANSLPVTIASNQSAIPVSGPLSNTELRATAISITEGGVQGVIDMPAAGTTYAVGRGIEVVCTTTGMLTFTYADASTRTRKFVADDNPYRFPDAVTQWSLPSGSTFAGTVCNLK